MFVPVPTNTMQYSRHPYLIRSFGKGVVWALCKATQVFMAEDGGTILLFSPRLVKGLRMRRHEHGLAGGMRV